MANGACEALEPNNSSATAETITSGTLTSLAICPAGDEDYYQFDIVAEQDMTIAIFFDNRDGDGDLDLVLFDSEQNVIQQSKGFDDMETIVRSMAMDNQLAVGTYFIQVVGFKPSVQNTYRLELTLSDGASIDAGVDAMIDAPAS